MKVLDLFSGIGGFSHGLDKVGFKTVAFCEMDEYCKLVLQKHWKGVKIYNDVKELKGKEIIKEHGTIDIVVGGFPVSRSVSQGQEKEQTTTDISGRKCFESSKSLKPRWVIGENVRGIVSIQNGMVFENVCTDLEGEGYEVRAFNIPRLQALAHHTKEKESGLWRTPDAHCDRGASSKERMQMKVNKKMPISINDQVAHPQIMWPTPTQDSATDRSKKYSQGGKPLTLAVKEQMWPTPTVNDSKNNAGPSQFKRKGTNLNVAVAKRGTQGGSLNPTWVEWLMGYPAEYTDLKHWETLSSPRSRKK